MIEISVIIPTYNRQNIINDLFRKMIDNIENQKQEMIIVDQSDLTNDKLLKYSYKYPHIFQYIKDDMHGLPHARNVGALHARGKILLYLDDDIIVCNMLVNAHLRNYLDELVGAVAGKVIEDDTNLIEGLTPKNMYGIDFFGRFHPSRGGNSNEYVCGFPGGNFSIRKDILTLIGGFDERFKGTAKFEETDVAYRLRKIGYKIVFEPDAEIYHLKYSSGGCRPTSINDYQYWRFRNATLFYLKNKSWIGFPFFLMTFVTIAFYKFVIQRRDLPNFFYVISGLFDGLRTFLKVKNENCY